MSTVDVAIGFVRSYQPGFNLEAVTEFIALQQVLSQSSVTAKMAPKSVQEKRLEKLRVSEK